MESNDTGPCKMDEYYISKDNSYFPLSVSEPRADQQVWKYCSAGYACSSHIVPPECRYTEATYNSSQICAFLPPSLSLFPPSSFPSISPSLSPPPLLCPYLCCTHSDTIETGLLHMAEDNIQKYTVVIRE